jgi:uncharacterized protein YjeT (DUF2065 family)
VTQDLLAAICLVLVIEGLFLLVGAEAWKRMAAQLLALPASTLRWTGAVCVVVGLLLLQWVRS